VGTFGTGTGPNTFFLVQTFTADEAIILSHPTLPFLGFVRNGANNFGLGAGNSSTLTARLFSGGDRDIACRAISTSRDSGSQCSLGGDGSITLGSATATLAFFGVTATGQKAHDADPTDLPSCITNLTALNAFFALVGLTATS